MISLKIIDVKKFMEKLLVSQMFDHFLVLTADVKTSFTWHLDGSVNSEYYSSDELEIMNNRNNALWSEVRPQIFNIIKGKKTPSYLKIVFMLPNEDMQRYADELKITADNISSLFLNIKFDPNGLIIITGVSQKTFSFDKSWEYEWDHNLKQFLNQNDILFE